MATTASPRRSNIPSREKKQQAKRPKVALFGHFGCANFGNETILEAFLHHLRHFQPDAHVTCICSGPEATAATYRIDAIPISEGFLQFFASRHPIVRKLVVGVLIEPYRWIKGLIELWHTDLLIVPGTGLLTDADGLRGPGPYNLLKWSLLGKLRRCKLLFVSIGAGPIHGTLGRCFVKSALALADFRSYRDNSSRQYLTSIGFGANEDQVYPDLAFSFPETRLPHPSARKSARPVAGLGLMVDPGRYGASGPANETYLSYLENLVTASGWLVSHGYDIRLLIGDLGDVPATRDFRNLVKGRLHAGAEGHIIDKPARSVDDLMSQIATTDIVVATRYHNVLLALLCNKPVISIAFHHKCESLMQSVGLSKYCLSFDDLEAESLIGRLEDLERNADELKSLISEKAQEFRMALDVQYQRIFNDACTR